METIFNNAVENVKNLRTDLLFNDKLDNLAEENQELLLQALSQLAIAKSTFRILEIRTTGVE
jgi:hypothetical protein|tara:strand:- start:550 stop:735 length:186 start_codon:yes stop_codon:yes gene_type:complete